MDNADQLRNAIRLLKEVTSRDDEDDWPIYFLYGDEADPDFIKDVAVPIWNNFRDLLNTNQILEIKEIRSRIENQFKQRSEWKEGYWNVAHFYQYILRLCDNKIHHKGRDALVGDVEEEELRDLGAFVIVGSSGTPKYLSIGIVRFENTVTVDRENYPPGFSNPDYS